MKAAVFSSSLGCQIANFHRAGFVLIRKPPSLTSQFVESINLEVLAHLEDLESSFQYRFWRFCNSVTTPSKRHSIPLPLSPGVRELLNSNISHVFPFLESQLSLESPLVELSSIVSQSGSTDQETHSDVPLSSPLILSAFIALTHVTLENGPTCMYQGSHTKAFHHIKAQPIANMQKFYSPDGYDEEIKAYEHSFKIADAQSNTAEALSADYPQYCAILEPGDMLLFDTKIAHHGLANTSLFSRSLLCFAFQQPDFPSCHPSSFPFEHEKLRRGGGSAGSEVNSPTPTSMTSVTPLATGCAPKVEGFTYHCHSTMTQEHITLRNYNTAA